MAFSAANSSVPGANAKTSTLEEVPEINVESLGFTTFAGETKLKLLPSPWPIDALPSSTSSLFSIASKCGLLAAAGPDKLVIAQTKVVRAAYHDPEAVTQNSIKAFDPSKSLTIDVPRLSHIAFTSDGAFLVMCAEDGGGLAVFDSSELMQEKKTPAFQMPTNGVSVRALIPNHAPETAHLVAVVLTGGQLMLADLKQQTFITGGNASQILKDGVSCVAWSVRGKQIVAGLGDGNAYQLEPSGAPKAFIRQPPSVQPDHHVSSIVWLSNDEFLVVHTPNKPTSPDLPPVSTLNYVKTDKGRTVFEYREVLDPAPAFGMNRVPPIHYICRLRKWHHLDDMLVMASVASTDVGLITKSAAPLTGAVDPNKITNVYTNTAFAEDYMRATLPMSAVDSMTDTTAIGMALDLSSEDKIAKPIPRDEMEQAPFPLPAMMLLNNEGVLSAWWIVLNEALRENKIYPGLVVAEGAASAAPIPSAPQDSPFAVGSASGPPRAPVFGNATFSKPAAPAFGQTGIHATGTFGSSAGLGQKPSVWGTASSPQTAGANFGQSSFGKPSTFGQPAFGSTSTPSPAAGGTGFGAVGGLGQKQSPWAAQTKSPASFGTPTSGESGFAKFGTANTALSPFGAVGGSSDSSSSLGQKTGSIFGTAGSGQSPFAPQIQATQSAFAPTGTTSVPTFGTGSGLGAKSSFGSTATTAFNASGSKFGSQLAFGTPAQPNSVFGQPPTTVPALDGPDMMEDNETSTPSDKKPSSNFGDFKFGSSFKRDAEASRESDSGVEKESSNSNDVFKKPLFGADFGAAVGVKESTPKIKREPESESPPSIFGIPDKKTEAPIFGKAIPGANKTPFSFGKPSVTPTSSPKPNPFDLPAPPQVTSKPQPSPSPATGPSTGSTASSDGFQDSEDDELEPDSPAEGIEMPESDEPETGSPAEAVEMPESDEESEESYEEEDDAPLPPDPSTHKSRPAWFNSPPPGAANDIKQQKPPKAPSPPLFVESPLFPSKTTTTPTGFPKAPITFAAPTSSIREPSRSPSPVRSASTPVGTAIPHLQHPTSRPVSRAAALPPQPIPELEPSITASDLEDEDYEEIRQQLEADIQPTLQLGQFIAHKDYLDTVTKPGVANQIERVYRDINSMIDTLGLNARTLASFIKGHSTLRKADGRSKEDLDYEEGDQEWCLVEIEDLLHIDIQLEDDLGKACLVDKERQIAGLSQMRKDLTRIRRKLTEVRKFVDSERSMERRAMIRRAPLDSKSAAKQREIRGKFSAFQKLLADAEDCVVVLRTQLATNTTSTAFGGGDDGDGVVGSRVPTVEAVESTIRKMTAMAEEKSGDIDVLERQMRVLGLATADSSRPSSSSIMMNKSMRGSVGMFSPSPKLSRNGGTVGKTFGLPHDSDDDDGDDGSVNGEEGGQGVLDVDAAAREAVLKQFIEVRKKRANVVSLLKAALRKRNQARPTAT